MGMDPIHLEQFNTLEIGTVFLPCRIASGDHIELFKLSESRIAILLFDVSGKGIEAGIIRNELLREFKGAIQIGFEHEKVINQVHQFLCHNDGLNGYATVFFGVIDTQAHTLTYCNAGHDPVMLLRGETLVTLDACMMQIGADSADIYTQESVPFQPGNKLIVYSDGFPDARNQANESFGFERMKAHVLDNRLVSAGHLAKSLHESVMSFSLGKEQKDDLSLMVIGFKTQDSVSFSLEKQFKVAFLKLDTQSRERCMTLLAPSLDIQSFETAESLLVQLNKYPDEVILVLAGSTVLVSELEEICTFSKLLEVIVLSHSEDPEWCKAVMRAGVRHISLLDSDMGYLKPIISESVKRVDQLKRAMFNTHQKLVNIVAFTADLLGHCQKNGVNISRFELASLTRLVFDETLQPINITDSKRKQESPSFRILTVEDDLNVRQRITSVLAIEGYEFFEAGDKNEAIESLKTQTFDCCLLDIGLPDGSGLELITVLKEQNPDIEIIMVTAFNNLEMIMPAFQKGVLDYIVKPIQNVVLLQKIDEASRRNFMNYVSKQDSQCNVVLTQDIPLRIRVLECLIREKVVTGKEVSYGVLYKFFPEIRPMYSPDTVISREALINDITGFLLSFLAASKKESL